jgi:TPR repeat protein
VPQLLVTLSLALLGSYIDGGKIGRRDSARAVILYRASADKGDALGQTNLGLCYLDGRGVNASTTDAVKWLRKAADQGQEIALLNLALCYDKGLGGLPVDNFKAFSLYEMAMEKDDVEAA